jgi:hypothetical protein
MFSRLRGALLAGLVLLFSAPFGASSHAQDRADDRVYQYRNTGGRQVFTNAGRVAVGGEPLVPLTLPELSSIDFQGASAAQLQQLDRGVQRAHDELQAGEHCQAIRASLRVPTSTFVWREHLRELGIGGALFAVALLVLAAWGGRLRALMPLAPLLGSLYLAYATYGRIDQRLTALREGMRACSSELPTAATASPSVVKERLESAASLQSTIDRAYQERARILDQSLH